MASLIALSDIVFGGPLVIVFLEADVVGCAPFVLVRADRIGCMRCQVRA